MKKCVLRCFQFVKLIKQKRRTLPTGEGHSFSVPIGVVLHISAKLRPNKDMEVAHGTAPHQRFSLPRGAALASYNSGIYRDDTAVGQSHICTTNYCDAGERRLKRAISFIGTAKIITTPKWPTRIYTPATHQRKPTNGAISRYARVHQGRLEHTGDCIWSSRRLPAFEGAILGRRHIAPIFSARGHYPHTLQPVFPDAEMRVGQCLCA